MFVAIKEQVDNIIRVNDECKPLKKRWPSKGLSLNRSNDHLASKEVQDQFKKLALIWQEETDFYSLIADRIEHPAFQKIVALGSPAVPLLLKELEQNPDFWFLALQKITGENPIPNSANNCTMDELSEAWFNWARENDVQW